MSSHERIRGMKRLRCSSVPQCIRVGPMRLSPEPMYGSGARARPSSWLYTMLCRIDAPRPPYSLGQSMPSHPPSFSFLHHATRRSQSPSSSSAKVSASASLPSLGAFLSSHARNSLRNASSSGVKLKSIVTLPRNSPAPALSLGQPEHALADDVVLNLIAAG